MMSDNIFDLEQDIMNCWVLVDDVDLLYNYIGEDPFFEGMYPNHQDKILNLLLGMKELYQMKYEKMFKSFEGVCSEYHKRGNSIRDLQSMCDDCNQSLARACNEREPLFDDPIDVMQFELQSRQDQTVRRSLNDATPEEWDKAARNSSDYNPSEYW